MKKLIFKIFSFVLITTFIIMPYAVLANDDIEFIEGRITNVHNPINEQDSATKKYVDDAIDMIPEVPAVMQNLGQSDTATISQKAVTDALNAMIVQNDVSFIPVVTTEGTDSALTANIPDFEVQVGKMIVLIPHVTGSTTSAITLNVNGDGSKQFTCADGSGALASFANSVPIVTEGVPLLIVRGETNWHVLNISKPNMDSVNGTLPIANGGTGATTASATVSNLGIDIATGSWSPTLINDSGANPTCTYAARYGQWRRISYGNYHVIFILFTIDANITNVGNTSGWARISGLPRVCNADTTAISYEACNNLTGSPNKLSVFGETSMLIPRTTNGLVSVRWQTGNTYIRAAGCYICAAS